MPKSPNFCAPTGLRKRESGKIPVCSKVAVLTGFLLCVSTLTSGKLFSQAKGGAMALQISSPDFSAGEAIPKKFTCDGPDVSPQLKWNEPPAETQSFALIMDDPDAPVGTWVHWVLYDLPADTGELPEGVARQEQLASGARQGRNDRTACQRRAARPKRFRQDRLQRAVSAARQAAPLSLQAVCARRKTGFEIRRDEGRR